MEYGSMFGDGAQRGPDFTAEALHKAVEFMNMYQVEQFQEEHGRQPTEFETQIIAENVKKELKKNGYDKEQDIVLLSDAQAFAFEGVKSYYLDQFLTPHPDRSFPPPNYINSSQEISDLSAFFFWGAWVCVVERPGSNFSYTHNWPYDAEAGNTPTSPVILWSVLGLLAFVLACGIVLYFHRTV